MVDSNWLSQLEALWDSDCGALWRLRQGEYSEKELQDVAALLSTIDLGDKQMLDKRLVTLLWYMYPFLEWQSTRIAEAGGDLVSYERIANQLRSEIERILGVP